jgi:SAM-dependent methyltransferase
MSGRPACLVCGGSLTGQDMIEGPDRLARTPGRFTVRCCGVCGAGITLPLASQDELAALYPADYAPHGPPEGRLAHRVRDAVRGRRERREASTPPLADLLAMPAGRALDVGCGSGDLGAALLRAGWRVSGLDTSDAACERAAARGLDVTCATLATADLPAAAFDAVVFQHSLEHVPDPPADLRRAAGLLRPLGRVYVTLPNFECWQRRRFGSRWFNLDLPRHRVHFVPGALERALRDAGLSEIRVRSFSSVTGLAGSIQYALAGRCLFPAGLGLEASLALAARLAPLARRLDARAGAGDLLYATADRPAGVASGAAT